MMRSTALTSAFALASVTLVAIGCTADAPTEAPSAGVDPVANQAAAAATPQLLASGLQGASGSAIGPGQALFVTEGAAGRISRVDPKTGQVTTFASGLPPAIIPIGGAIDVAFIGGTAYALVTLVGPEFGGSDVVGIYRVDGPDQFTVIADIGAFNLANPPTIEFDFFLPTGLQYAIEPYRGGFLVSDGHLNRVLHVTLDGEIQVFRDFGNTVPTGLAVHGNTIYMAEAGAVPHLPEDGRVVAFTPQSTSATVVATGAPLAVDVGFGRGRTLYALAQGTWDGAFEGSPALPNTGSLMRVNADGSMTSVADGLNLPTSFQVIGNTAYVVTLTGEVWTIENLRG
jgi:sugar lactone lactonase YvrE